MIFRKTRFVILSLLLTEIIIIVIIYNHYGNSSTTNLSDDSKIINVFLGKVKKNRLRFFFVTTSSINISIFCFYIFPSELQ